MLDVGPLEMCIRDSLFIAEPNRRRVRRVDARTKIITTVAGTGADEYSGDGGPAIAAGLSFPIGVALDVHSNLFIADFAADRIRRVDARSGIISTVAGNGDSRCVFTEPPRVGAKATSVCLSGPRSIATDSAGNLFIADGRDRIYRVDAITGVLTVFAGGGLGDLGDAGPATAGSLLDPWGLSFDTNGDLFVADYGHCLVRRIDSRSGVITTVAGSAAKRCDAPGTGGPALSARLTDPGDLVVDGVGNLYFAERTAGRVWRLDLRTRFVSLFAGTGRRGFGGDGGPARRSRLDNPSGLALDRAGNLFVSDFVTNRVRRIDARTGTITTVAGNGMPRRVNVLRPLPVTP